MRKIHLNEEASLPSKEMDVVFHTDQGSTFAGTYMKRTETFWSIDAVSQVPKFENITQFAPSQVEWWIPVNELREYLRQQGKLP